MVIWTRPQKGFTIVELLIVIVVIAILAAITIVAYNGIQQRARDTKRKDDVAEVAKLVQMYNVDKGTMGIGSGCGNGNGSGWLNYTYAGYTSMMDCLKATTNTTTNIQDDSINCGQVTTCHAYMQYTCTLSGQTVTYIYANLEGGTHNGDEVDGTCAPNNDTLYGMNYYVRVVDS